MAKKDNPSTMRINEYNGYLRALEGLYKCGYYTEGVSSEPESQHLRHPYGRDVWVTNMPEQRAVRIALRRNGDMFSLDVSYLELTSLQPGLLQHAMDTIIRKLDGRLEKPELR